MTKDMQDKEVSDHDPDASRKAIHPVWKGMSQTIVIICLFILAFMLTRWLVHDEMLFGEAFFATLIIQGLTLGYGVVMLKLHNTFLPEKCHRIEKALAFTQLGLMCLIEIVSLFCMGLIFAVTSLITL